MNANFPGALTRRSFFTLSAASVSALGVNAGAGATQLAIDDEPDFDNSFTAVDDMFVVDWDSELWSEYQLSGLSSDGTIRLRNPDKKGTHDPGYTLAVSFQNIAWGSETVDETIDNWFNLGTLGSVIFDQWDDDDEMGFIFNSGTTEANTRTLMVFIYRPIDGQPDRRLWSNLVVDQSIFDSDQLKQQLEGFTIDGGPMSLKYDDDALVRFLESNLD